MLSLLTFVGVAYGETPKGKVIGSKYRSICLDIIKAAFTSFDYVNDTIINSFSSNINSAYEELKKDSTADRKMFSCLGNIPTINGDKPQKCFEDISIYLEQVCKGCGENNRDTNWVGPIREKISNLKMEYELFIQCEKINDFKDYQKKYGKNGLFNKLVKPDSLSLIQMGESSLSAMEPEEKVQFQGDAAQDCPTSVENPDQNISEKDKSFNIVPILLVMLVLLLGGGCIYYRRKSQSPKKIERRNRNESTPKHRPPMEIVEDIPQEDLDKNPQKDDCSYVSNIKWIVVGASVKGNGHIQSNMPCQDNHKFESIGDGWGIAIVSDGAGSAAHSELGSKVVVERGMTHFKNLIEKEEWMKKNVLPTDVEWLQKSYYVMRAIRDDVVGVSKKNNVEVKSLSATCLVVIYSPLGLLAVHVGDGRMGYKSAAGEWKSMMTPHKGEEANQTIFIVSDFWSIPNFVLSDVLVPESTVVREPVRAFALMSDGCENTAWKCTTFNQETGKYYDQNKPFEGFFNPLEETLISFQAQNVPDMEQQAKWNRFIESGTDGFVREQDDKTMIYGYYCTQQEIGDYIKKTKASLN